MAIIKPLVGKWVALRCAEETDAEFTLAIRNDQTLTEFIPRIDGSIEQQREWIRIQRQHDNDVFLLIDDSEGRPKGTVSYYNFCDGGRTCEIGRYISQGSALQNVETIILILDYIFSKTEISQVILNNDSRNHKIIRLWEKFGAEFFENISMNGWEAAQYRLSKKRYGQCRKKIITLLRY